MWIPCVLRRLLVRPYDCWVFGVGEWYLHVLTPCSYGLRAVGLLQCHSYLMRELPKASPGRNRWWTNHEWSTNPNMNISNRWYIKDDPIQLLCWFSTATTTPGINSESIRFLFLFLFWGEAAASPCLDMYLCTWSYSWDITMLTNPRIQRFVLGIRPGSFFALIIQCIWYIIVRNHVILKASTGCLFLSISFATTYSYLSDSTSVIYKTQHFLSWFVIVNRYLWNSFHIDLVILFA